MDSIKLDTGVNKMKHPKLLNFIFISLGYLITKKNIFFQEILIKFRNILLKQKEDENT